mgnify:CR=1 FL=1
MKIFEIQLQSPDGDVVYKSIVPEVHIQEKVDTLLRMNEISNVGAIIIKEMGDISDRYINKFIQNDSGSTAAIKAAASIKKGA